ncbi:type VII secretion target [Planosporangium mesophilum]|uniref:ESX-1 secretion-associated protein n=1 Tax=Planosporangium mesophilum TaxID=689768 RepID=A0A8J3TAC9_9ACTN|nr:type VII secretion target [Planosporangium mesophilum]NJC83974.1 ESX-1 secretion-associated protein [Planosporangium mesophilum]GII22659.1 hypothetical protein Pme01_22560 [Planosporangium mesophilum]
MVGSGDGGLVRFPAEVVQHHAGVVEQVSEAVETARSAVREVTMDTQAYGVLCQFLPALLTPVFDLGVDALHSSVDALRETAAKLRTAAENTVGTDVSSAQRIGAAGESGRPRLELPL